MRSFSYTSHAGVIFIWGISLTHPVLTLILSADFLLHIPCWLHFYQGSFLLHIPCWLHFYIGSFSYTSRAGFIFMRGVSLSYTSRAGIFFIIIFFLFFFFFFFFFFLIRGLSLTHPVLASYLAGEYLFHIPCWLYFSV